MRIVLAIRSLSDLENYFRGIVGGERLVHDLQVKMGVEEVETEKYLEE